MARTMQYSRRRLGYVLSLFVIALLIVWLVVGVSNLSFTAASKQLAQLNYTVRRYAVQCYALEGRYPDNLEYLGLHYGLTLDYRHYVYHYRYLGANIMPEIAVWLTAGQ
jgi:hypothetical protein